MLIRPATHTDIPTIKMLADKIWRTTYQDVLPTEQIDFMLQKMYSEDALLSQMEEEGILFLMVERDGIPLAFAGYSVTGPAEQIFKLHKIYISDSEQGKGIGRKLIDYVIKAVKSQGGKILELNVNRANPAFGFYKKLGFEVHKMVDIPYYEYVLNDYVMRKKIN